MSTLLNDDRLSDYLLSRLSSMVYQCMFVANTMQKSDEIYVKTEVNCSEFYDVVIISIKHINDILIENQTATAANRRHINHADDL